jgi:nicotinamide mononucleotide adenylyltransferase
MLMLGAAGASMVVTIRPALAQTAGSVLTCEIPIPDPRQSGKWIGADGSVVAPFTQGAVRPPWRPLKGQDVKVALRNHTVFPGTTYEQTQAYTKYMQRLQNGNSGFTCFVSLKTR